MATFEYTSLTESGRSMGGIIEAASREQAVEMLTDMNLVVAEITKVQGKKSKTGIGRTELLLFNQQLASITKAGIPIERGLRELANDVSSRSMRKMITAIANELEAGASIDEAIEKRQRSFPPLYSRILKAGVRTGRLSEMLTSLNRHLEMGAKTKRIVLEALSYPLVVLFFAFTIIVALFIFVIPTFGEVLTDMGDGARLPWLTQQMLQLARNIIPIAATFGAFVLSVILILSLLSTNAAGRRFREAMLMKMPILGRLYHSSILARMSEAMALLVSSGCDMGECLRLSSGASGSEMLKLESSILASQVEKGAALMEAGHIGKTLPRLFLYSMQLGSQRNELQDNLHSLGEMYAEQSRCLQAKLQTMLLPFMIIFVGVMIGTIILSMFLPIISITTALM
ncbi:MAG: type II secretion system F family protein [Planctomycetes bacterium]|nr:type II secretion system F family protein [Planctomycetota bacterium]